MKGEERRGNEKVLITYVRITPTTRAPARRRWRSLSGVARLAVIHDRHPDHPDHLDLSEYDDDARDIASASPRARAVEGGLLERALSAAVHHGEEDESDTASEPPPSPCAALQ